MENRHCTRTRSIDCCCADCITIIGFGDPTIDCCCADFITIIGFGDPTSVSTSAAADAPQRITGKGAYARGIPLGWLQGRSVGVAVEAAVSSCSKVGPVRDPLPNPNVGARWTWQ